MVLRLSARWSSWAILYSRGSRRAQPQSGSVARGRVVEGHHAAFRSASGLDPVRVQRHVHVGVLTFGREALWERIVGAVLHSRSGFAGHHACVEPLRRWIVLRHFRSHGRCVDLRLSSTEGASAAVFSHRHFRCLRGRRPESGRRGSRPGAPDRRPGGDHVTRKAAERPPDGDVGDLDSSAVHAKPPAFPRHRRWGSHGLWASIRTPVPRVR